MSPTPADRYAAIERQYGQGQWQQVLETSAVLLRDLADTPDTAVRQRLLLLQGHTLLHGLGQAAAAAALYQQVLDTQPEPVLKTIALHELARAQAMEEGTVHDQPLAVAEPAMVAAPLSPAFPFSAGAIGTPPAELQASAMPWLEALPEPEPPTKDQSPAAASASPWVETIEPNPMMDEPKLIDAPEVIDEPEQIAVHQADPARSQIIDLQPRDRATPAVAKPWSPAEEAELAQGMLEVVLG